MEDTWSGQEEAGGEKPQDVRMSPGPSTAASELCSLELKQHDLS